MSTEIRRDHKGALSVWVNGNPLAGALVTGIENVGALGLCAAIYVPLSAAILGEAQNVVPFVRPQPL